MTAADIAALDAVARSLDAQAAQLRAAPPAAPRRMTPVELTVKNLLWCMGPDKEVYGQAIAIVLGTLAAGDPDPYAVIRAAMHTAAGIVTGEGIERAA